jgi:RNA polymerase sigma-70 factor (ECF subfamily)
MQDAELIAESSERPELFREVFERHYDAVWRYARHRLGTTLADDLASETFARAFALRSRYRPIAPSALPWLLGIATNLIADQRRRESRRLSAYARAGALEAGAGHEDDLFSRLAAKEQGREIAALLSELRAEDRETLFLSAIAGLDYGELAEALGVAKGTIGARLSRIRTQLSPLLNPLRNSEEVFSE